MAAGEPERITLTGRERLAWQSDNTTRTFRIYVDDVAVDATDVSCTAIVATGQVECSAPMPAMSAGPHELRVAATLDAAEGEQSDALLVLSTASDETSRSAPDPDAVSIVTGFSDPTDIAVVDRDLALVSERSGRVIAVSRNGTGVSEAARISDVQTGAGRGVLSIAASAPDDPHQYVFVLASSTVGARLIRLTRTATTLFNQVTLLDLPLSTAAPSAVVRVGPDRKVYIALDDGGDASARGDEGSYGAKVLRVDPDGTAVDDAKKTSVIFSIGLNHPVAMAWSDSGNRFWIAGGDADGSPTVAVAQVNHATRLQPNRVAVTVPSSIAGIDAVNDRESTVWIAGVDGTVMTLTGQSGEDASRLGAGGALVIVRRQGESVLAFDGNTLVRLPLARFLHQQKKSAK